MGGLPQSTKVYCRRWSLSSRPKDKGELGAPGKKLKRSGYYSGGEGMSSTPAQAPGSRVCHVAGPRGRGVGGKGPSCYEGGGLWLCLETSAVPKDDGPFHDLPHTTFGHGLYDNLSVHLGGYDPYGNSDS